MPFSLRLLFVITFLATAFCALVHVATFFGFAISAYDLLIPLLILVTSLFVVWPMIVWKWRKVPRRNMVGEIFSQVSSPFRWGGAALIIYFFVNYALCRSGNSWAQPTLLKDGRFVLQAGDQILRTLTQAEYMKALSIELRLHAGHLMVFYGLAFIAIKALWIKTGPKAAE